MNRAETAERIKRREEAAAEAVTPEQDKVEQAYRDGAEIAWQPNATDYQGEWYNVLNPKWLWRTATYRVKPKPLPSAGRPWTWTCPKCGRLCDFITREAWAKVWGPLDPPRPWPVPYCVRCDAEAEPPWFDKSIPTYRPFRNEETSGLLGRRVERKSDKGSGLIHFVLSAQGYVSIGVGTGVGLESLLDDWQFIDEHGNASPCGVPVK